MKVGAGMSVDEFVDALNEGRLDPEAPQVAPFAILLARTG